MKRHRTCIGCGESAPREHLLRLVVDPAGLPTLDPGKSAPGRGAWAHPSEACLERAETMRALGRAFRGRARAPERGALLQAARLAGLLKPEAE